MQTLGINVVCETSDTNNFKFSLVVICSSGNNRIIFMLNDLKLFIYM